MLLELLYFFWVNLTLVVPGYVLIKRSKFLDKNPGLQLCLAYTLSIVCYAILATITYVLKIDPIFTRVITWAVILVSIFLFIRDGLLSDFIAKYKFPLACLLAASLFSLLFISLPFSAPRTFVPDPQPEPGRNYSAFNVKVLNVAHTQANDNYVPYRQAQFFINRSDPAKDSFIGEWGVDFFVRTPLMGAVTANYFNLLGDKPPIDYSWSSTSTDPGHTYQKFQVLAQILNSLLVIPGFYLISKLFSKRTAYMSLLFIIPSIYFMYNEFFSWPKSLVAFFILTSWILLLEKKPKYTFLAGVISGVAYLTHDLAVLYVGASFIYLLVGKRFRELLLFTGPVIILALPWMITASIIYNKTSNFVYYPISTQGIPQAADRAQTIHQFLHTSPLRLLKIRIDNIVYLLSPYQLVSSEGGQAISNRLWALSLYSIPGALGLGLIIPAFAGVFRRLLSWTGTIFVLVPVLLSTIIIGWPKGLGALHFAEAVVMLIIGLAVYFLDSLRNKIWLLIAFLVNVIQLVYFIGFSYKFAVGNWLSSLSALISLTFMVVILLGCAWLLYRVGFDKKNRFLARL